MMIRKIYILALLSVALLLGGCRSENDSPSRKAKGYLRLSCRLEGQIADKGMPSKTNVKLRSSNPHIPQIESLICRIMDANEATVAEAKASSFSAPYSLPEGNYKIKAYYGEAEAEGFGKSYYEGRADFEIMEEKSTEVALICREQKSLVEVHFSPEVESYFEHLSLKIRRQNGSSEVEFAQDEKRPAYFIPGDLLLTLSASKSGMQPVSIDLGSIANSAPHTLYHLNIGINAGKSELTVTYDQPTEVDPIVINVSDEVLNAPAPAVKPNGFAHEGEISFKAGTSPEVNVLLIAKSGLKSCRLTMQSALLSEKGIPTSVDLLNDQEEANRNTWITNGLVLKELSANSKFAVIDFGSFFSKLTPSEDAEKNIIKCSIHITDKIGRTTSTDLSWQVKVLPLIFQLGAVAAQKIGTTQVDIPLTLSADYSTMTEEQLKRAKGEFAVMEETNQDHLPLNLPFELINEGGLKLRISIPPLLSDKKINITYEGVKTLQSIIEVQPINWHLYQENGTADTWFNRSKAILQIDEDEPTRKFILKHLRVGLTKDGTNESAIVKTQNDGDKVHIDMTNLASGTDYKLTAGVSSLLTESLNISTEQELQLPNHGLEDWSSYQTSSSYWTMYYPWKNKNNPPASHWDTNNDVSVGPGLYDGANLAYRANAAVMQTSYAHSGKSAALVRTVGYGKNATAAGSWSAGVQICIGNLFLGSYDKSAKKEVEGVTFASRPHRLSFYSKYVSKNSADRYQVVIKLVAADGSVIGSGQLPTTSATTNSSYTQKSIDINYTDLTKKATKIMVMVKSGTDASNTSANIDYGSVWNSAQHLGSKLYIDDLTLSY